MKITYIAASAILLAGCAQPEPLCNRAEIKWDKYGTAEVPLACAPKTATYIKPPNTVGDPHDPPEPPKEPPGHNPPKGPPEPPHEPPAKREHRDNGLGNGDDQAPGRSLNRNRAENQAGNPGHKSGKAQNSD